MSRPFLVTAVLIFAGLAPADEKSHGPDSAAGARLRADLQRLPLSFEANRGQLDERIRFIARARAYSLLLAPDEARMYLTNSADQVTWRLAGQSDGAEMAGEELLPGVTHYFAGPDANRWRTNIPNYRRVRCRNIYPGIDAVYRGDGRTLEYDFEAAPGADPGLIRIAFAGFDRMEIDARGDLVIYAGDGEIRHRKPVIWEEADGLRRPVEGRYVMTGPREVGFDIAEYDRGRKLVIDPVLIYSTYLGGPGADEAAGIAVDGEGNAYLTGSTSSARMPAPRGIGPGRIFSGGTDAFVLKLNPAGTEALYTAIIGGKGQDRGLGIAIDRFGNAYVAGATDSFDFPATIDAVQPKYAGGDSDAFVLKLNSRGSAFFYSTFLGGFREDAALAIAIDDFGNAYVTGHTRSNDFPTTAGTVQPFRVGSDLDAFVTKLNSTGSFLVYSTFLAGSFDDEGAGIALDSSTNAYIVGTTVSGDFPSTRSAFQRRCGNNTNVFVTKLNRFGSIGIYSSCLGGRSDNRGRGIAVDDRGQAFITGSTTSTDFPTTPDALNRNCGRGRDAFVTKWNGDGTGLLFSTCVGGDRDDEAFAIAIDPGGSSYITGETRSDNFPVTPDAFQPETQGFTDAFLARLDPLGRGLLSSTYFGGEDDDSGLAIAVLPDIRQAFIAGVTRSTALPVTPGAVQPFRVEETEGFAARFEFVFEPFINPDGVVNGANFEAGSAVAPGSIAAVFGRDLAGYTLNAPMVPLSLDLAGTSVFINGVRAPLFFVSPLQVNFQVPYDVPPGTAAITVTSGGKTAESREFTVAPAAPGVFFFFDTAPRRAIAQNQNGSLNEPGNPARPGSVVTVYLTGIGQVDNPVAAGAPAPPAPLSRAVLQASATIGGQPAHIQFIGLTPGFIGLAQANLVTPTLPAGEHPVAITVGDFTGNMAVVSVAP